MLKSFFNSKQIRAALLIYWVVLSYLLFKPVHLQAQPWFIFPNIDKVVHFIVFAVLAFLLEASFTKMRKYYFFQILILYAVTTEIIQEMMHMGRSMEVLDVIADTLGIFCGYCLHFIIDKRFNI